MGDFPKAQECYDKALALDEDHAGVFNNLGLLHLSIFIKTRNKGNSVQALNYFQKAIDRDPTLVAAYNGMGDTYNISGQRDEAVIWWERAVALDPDFHLSLISLGMAYLAKGDKTTALNHLERFLKLRKDSLSPDERKRVDALITQCKK